MANPGTIIAGKKQMLKGGISQPRNKALFKMFNLIGLGEHVGSGVPDIYKAWHDAGLSEPMVEENFGGGNPDRTILTLPLVSDDANSVLLGKGTKKSTKKGTKGEEVERRTEQVFEAINNNPSIKNSELEDLINISQKQLQLSLRKLQDEKRIRRDGNNRKGKWIID